MYTFGWWTGISTNISFINGRVIIFAVAIPPAPSFQNISNKAFCNSIRPSHCLGARFQSLMVATVFPKLGILKAGYTYQLDSIRLGKLSLSTENGTTIPKWINVYGAASISNGILKLVPVSIFRVNYG